MLGRASLTRGADVQTFGNASSPGTTPSSPRSVPRPLRGLFAVLFFEILGASLTIPIFTYFCIVELNLSATKVGLVMSGFSAAQLLGAPIMGRISDAVGRRPVLLACFFWAAVCFLTTARVTTFSELLVVRTLAGLSGGSIPITQAMVMDSAGVKERPLVLGIMGGLLGVAFTLGPGATALILTVFDLQRRYVFVVAALFALAGCLVGSCVLQETHVEEKRRSLVQALQTDAGVKGGLAAMAMAPAKCLASALAEVREICTMGLCCIWLARFCVSFAFLSLFATYSFLIRDAFLWGDLQFGYILAFSGLIGAVVQLLVYPMLSRSLGKHLAFSLGCVFLAIYFTLLPLVTLGFPSAKLHLLGQILFVVGSSICDPSIPDLVGAHTPEDRMGLAQGLSNAFRSLASVLAPVLAGKAYDISPYIVYTMASTSMIVAGICVGITSLVEGSNIRKREDVTTILDLSEKGEKQPLVKKWEK